MSFDFGEFFRRIFTPPGTGGLEANTTQGIGIARAAANDALSQQRDATAAIVAASVPGIDREDARVAAEGRLRRTLGQGSFANNFSGTPAGPAPIDFKQLFGQS